MKHVRSAMAPEMKTVLKYKHFRYVLLVNRHTHRARSTSVTASEMWTKMRAQSIELNTVQSESEKKVVYLNYWEFDKYRIHKTWHYLLQMAGHFQYFIRICIGLSSVHIHISYPKKHEFCSRFFTSCFFGTKPKSQTRLLQHQGRNEQRKIHNTSNSFPFHSIFV